MESEAGDPQGAWITREEAYDAAPVAMCVISRDLRCLTANPQFAVVFGRTMPEILGSHIEDLLPGTTRLAKKAFTKADSGKPISKHVLPPTKGHTYRLKAKPMIDASGTIIGLSCAMVDITEERAALKAVQDMESMCNFALQSADQWIWEYNLETGVVWRSPHWKLTLGYAPDETVEGDETVAWGIIHPDDRRDVSARFDRMLTGKVGVFEATYRVRHKNKLWVWIFSRGKIVERDADSRPLRVLATSIDVSRQKQAEEELSATIRQREQLERELVEANRRLTALSEIDPLTELPNRRKFDQVLALETRRRERSRSPLAVLMIDVDHFKAFNDLYGHPEGDECLRLVAETLRSKVKRSGDMVARYGGEEFVAVLADTDENEAVAVAQNMLSAIHQLKVPHAGSDAGIVTLSIGVSLIETGAKSGIRAGEIVLRAADRALYAAKQDGRNVVALATPGEGGAVNILRRSEKTPIGKPAKSLPIQPVGSLPGSDEPPQ